MAAKRKYELKKRAEGVEETRRRITEATSELHREVGPAATQISEIARRAGVQRRTVYNHFPDETSLFAACSAHWRARHPAPDPSGWLEIDNPHARLRRALRELYGWYRETEAMTANVLRDAELLPSLRQVVEQGLGAYLAAVRTLLAGCLEVGVGRRRHVDAAVAVVVDFHVWRALAALGDEDAAELAAMFVEVAAGE